MMPLQDHHNSKFHNTHTPNAETLPFLLFKIICTIPKYYIHTFSSSDLISNYTHSIMHKFNIFRNTPEWQHYVNNIDIYTFNNINNDLNISKTIADFLLKDIARQFIQRRSIFICHKIPYHELNFYSKLNGAKVLKDSKHLSNSKSNHHYHPNWKFKFCKCCQIRMSKNNVSKFLNQKLFGKNYKNPYKTPFIFSSMFGTLKIIQNPHNGYR